MSKKSDKGRNRGNNNGKKHFKSQPNNKYGAKKDAKSNKNSSRDNNPRKLSLTTSINQNSSTSLGITTTGRATDTTTGTVTNRKGLSALQSQFAKKLEGAKFRVINEALYTTTGDDSFREFQKNPDNFDIYHSGYREQAAQWPINPLDCIINWIKNRPNTEIVADMGCGDGRLSQSVTNKVHSFDLISKLPHVTACDIANVPLGNETIDIAVFCLSLMGTNISDFIKEAHRIMKVNGTMKIIEVRSRFDEDGRGIKRFISFLKVAGFDIRPTSALNSNKMFFEVECIKSDRPPSFDEFSAKACVYKKR